MAILCNVLLVTIGIACLAGQISSGHELFVDSLNEGERQSCPNINCLGVDPCSSDDECFPGRCCIDMVNTLTCCVGSATENTTTTGNPTTTDQEFPVCTDYYENPCQYPEDCACTQQYDCFTNEVCCLEITTEGAEIHFKFFCHSTIPLVPTPPQPPVGEKCPTTTPPLLCAPFQSPGSCIIPGTPPTITCRADEICCQVGRDDPPCCVVYP